MKRFIAVPMMLAALCASCYASASDDPPPVGTDTREWVQLQKSETNKAPARGLPGEAADRVYQRYLQSFTRPIPERFERDRVNGEGQK